MAAATEALVTGAQGFRSSALKRPVTLSRGNLKLRVDQDAGIRSVDSLVEGRALFGRQQFYFYKLQAGITIASPRADWSVKLAPSIATFTGRLFDSVDVMHVFEFPPSPSTGCIRRIKLRNGGTSTLRLRLIGLFDPTAAHFREGASQWGSLGVNSFNRESHIAMDEISDPHPARVIGSSPGPSRFYMTTDRGRAAELLQGGDLPEPTAGMSGLVLVLSLHELELSPGEQREISFASFYSPEKLESVLSDFGRFQGGGSGPARKPAPVGCSSPRIAEASSWAWAALAPAVFADSLLDRMDSLRGLGFIDKEGLVSLAGRTKSLLRRDGFLPHSEDEKVPGILETSLFLSGISHHLALTGDKTTARPYYLMLKKMGNALVGMAKGGSLTLDPGRPQGWRRRIRSGYPAGEIPEVSLAVASALLELSKVARLLAKPEDAARFRERSELIADHASKRLVDERGFMGLCADESGRIRSDETVDMAVASYRYPPLASAASAGVHRLLEKDFETEYGPRTVPTTNRLYFHSSYGEGQLGGCWTRAAMAFSWLAYRAGLPGIGSLALEKVAKLATDDALKLGGVPGSFPLWVDVEGREAHGETSDPVAASRFVQTIIEGELGFSSLERIPVFNPPGLSTLKWILAREIWVGEEASVFVGRADGKAYTFASCQKADVPGGQKFGRSESIEVSPRSAAGISFYGPGQVVCFGNSSSAPLTVKLAVAGRASGLAKKLSTSLDEFEPGTGTWNKIGTLRVSPTLAFDALLGPGEWKAYRISND